MGGSMARIFFKKAGRMPSPLASLGLLVTIFALMTLLMAGPITGYLQPTLGNAEQVFALRVKLIDVTSYQLILAALLTAAGIIHGRTSIRYRASWRGTLAALLSMGIALPTWTMYRAGHETPVLHDISTNLSAPLFFKHLPERQYSVGEIATFVGGRLAPNYRDQHTNTYPHLTTSAFKVAKADLVEVARKTALKLGWQLVYQSIEDGQLEAICTHPWLQQRNNIIVRVRADAAQSMLDIRSVSALEVGDFGVNAQIIEAFLSQLREELAHL